MKRVRAGWGVLVAMAMPILVTVGLLEQWVVLPDRWNPWAPLWPLDQPNALTPFKLARLSSDPQACMGALKATTLSLASMPDRQPAEGCGWSDAVRITALPARVGPPFVLSCPAAASLAMWERHTLQPLAEAAFGQRVAAVEHFGSYACRDIAGRSGEGGTNRSEHARANAIDIAGFVLADGATINIARDWHRPTDDPRRRFLQAVHDGACGWWDVVLGPDYNAAHRDHFHFDRGGHGACR